MHLTLNLKPRNASSRVDLPSDCTGNPSALRCKNGSQGCGVQGRLKKVAQLVALAHLASNGDNLWNGKALSKGYSRGLQATARAHRGSQCAHWSVLLLGSAKD